MPTTWKWIPESSPHKCTVAAESEIRVEFGRAELTHEYEGEKHAEYVVMMSQQTQVGYLTTVVDFCPFCGIELSTALRFGYKKPEIARQARLAEREGYFEYRRRWNRRPYDDAPLRESEWRRLVDELEEIETLLVGDAGSYQAELFQRKQYIYRQLILPDIRPDKGRIEVAKEPLPEFDVPQEDHGWWS